MLVAVIDDEPLWLKTMSRVLAREGFDALLIDDASEALARVPERRPDVAIIDGLLPGLHGVELARRLRDAMGESCPTLLLVSGDVGGVPDTDGLFVAIYQKPVPLDVLLAFLRRASAGG